LQDFVAKLIALTYEKVSFEIALVGFDLL